MPGCLVLEREAGEDQARGQSRSTSLGPLLQPRSSSKHGSPPVTVLSFSGVGAPDSVRKARSVKAFSCPKY